MITTQEEYYHLLYRIQENNAPTTAILLPSTERTYYIDLNKREIEAPEFLSVEHDHTAETLYFVVDRYYDHQDLSQMTCVIQYVNANNESYVYLVPYYDIDTLGNEFVNRMIIPWNIGGNVTAYPGEVTFSFRFYKIDPYVLQASYTDEHGNFVVPNDKTIFLYNLSTQAATSKVLHGIGTEILEEEYYYIAPSEVLNIYQKIDDLQKLTVQYWEGE